MRYTIAALLLVDGAILVWAWRSMRDDFAMVVFALVCVTFFGSLPIALGVITRRMRERESAGHNRRTAVRRPPPAGPEPDA